KRSRRIRGSSFRGTIPRSSCDFRNRGRESRTSADFHRNSQTLMQPRIQELLTYLDAHFEGVRSAFESVPSDKRETSPSAGGWSRAGIIEHLAIAETSIGRLISTRVAASREAGIGAETDVSSVLETFAIANAVGDRSRKIVSNERLHPTQLS